MAGMSIFITSKGILVADGGTAATAISQKLSTSIASGEVTQMVINRANDGAPIIEGALDVDDVATLSNDAISGDWNAYTRDTFAAIVGTLAGMAALPAGPAASLAADVAMSEAYADAYDAASNWSQNQDWSPLFDSLDGLVDAYDNLGNDLFDAFGNWWLNTFLPEGKRPMDIGTSNFFTAANNWRPPVDPLTLDLDGDGLETLGLDTANPILFDHDGDGVKTASGWVAPDDGFLVLDRNGNGTIDSGRELFGDETPLVAGGTAADGFSALALEDTNLDGKVDAADARFADLRVWRDLNQDGISQASELTTLTDAGIAALNVAKTANSQTLANGNRIADLGSFTRTDGSAGTLGDLDLAENTFISQFTDSIPLTAEAEALPDMQGSGQVRDLREAASLSATLATTLGDYAAATTRDAQQAQLDALIEAWSDTSTFATTATGAYAGRMTMVNFDGVVDGSAEHQAWLDKLTVLERFNGRLFREAPAGTDPVMLHIGAQQMVLLDQSYAALRDSVYGALVVQTRFKPLIDSIDLVLNEGGIELDFSAVEQRRSAANESVFEIERAA